jgi:hypothetical protein
MSRRQILVIRIRRKVICKINLNHEHDDFRLAQVLSWSNRHTSSFYCIML